MILNKQSRRSGAPAGAWLCRKDLGVEGDERLSGDLHSQVGSCVLSRGSDGGPWQAVCWEEHRQVLGRTAAGVCRAHLICQVLHPPAHCLICPQNFLQGKEEEAWHRAGSCRVGQVLEVNLCGSFRGGKPGLLSWTLRSLAHLGGGHLNF